MSEEVGHVLLLAQAMPLILVEKRFDVRLAGQRRDHLMRLPWWDIIVLLAMRDQHRHVQPDLPGQSGRKVHAARQYILFTGNQQHIVKGQALSPEL